MLKQRMVRIILALVACMALAAAGGAPSDYHVKRSSTTISGGL